MAIGRHTVVWIGRFSDAFIRKGVVKSFGVLLPAMTVYLNTNYTTIGLILSLNAAFTQLACLVMNPLIKWLGSRRVAIIGGTMTGLCTLCTAFTNSIYLTGCLLVSAGFFSAGSNLGTTTTLRWHFGPRFGSVNSLALIGISAGSTLLPLLTAELLRIYGLSGTLLILGGLLLNELPIGAVMVPPRNHFVHVATHSDEVDCDTKMTVSGVLGDSDRGGEIYNVGNGVCNPADGKNEVEISIDQELSASSANSCRSCMKSTKDTFDFRIFREEKYFTVFMLPVLILSALANYGWVLFVTSYAISVGVDSFRAAYLAAVGAAGGMASCAVQAIVFHWQPMWSPHVMALLSLSGAVTLMVQTLNSTLHSLLICSFVIGASLYGVSVVVDAVVAVIVAPKNFQAAIAFTFALEGIGTLIAGPFSGFLFDYTGSFETVFLVLGGIAAIAHILGVLLIIIRRCSRQHHNVAEQRL
ncbi:monocarboxylate transporter 6-like [Lytechinus variegatus]|uniref:monocarboxylate transporter 6-like n=1 Tax=Lytechinus variegatus TaxID=7654 RepID=UPI001BB1ED9F|nr:monocarboxylate transporter 6-like [Lytechinus variegatus]XP_041483355.1 monocarboxylate transporter 6-like [Lytechinus variegatus]XP_041483356.1 monocarboxylate transporter 6-like [Lytechinus variegatus]